ncbi:MAG: long-chain fatty acid--CoA ligase, partial [Rhodobacteraceae bacterium]|nr:long-chain fatty acid--CoA ligase [Paracoccaceae bacterium]
MPIRASRMTGMTLEQAVRHVTTTNPAFAVGKAVIRGVDYKVFTNAPVSVPAMMQASRAAQGDGAAEYLAYEDERWSYDEFCAEANRMGHALAAEFGITKGDRVAIAMRNCPELLILTMAISGLGAVVVFLNAWWTTEELDYALTDSAARFVFADAERLRRLEPLAGPRGLTLIGVRDGAGMASYSYAALLAGSPDASFPVALIEAEDDFAIMYSSGTTGHPKGVVLTHRGAVNAVYTWLLQAVMAPLI